MISLSQSRATRKPQDWHTISSVASLTTPAGLAYKLSQGKWIPADHLLLLSQRLTALAMGRIRRLVVMMPPRHGKSQMISHYFLVWLLNMWPEKHVILCSYESSFAAEWGRAVRNTVAANQDSLRVQLSEDSKAANLWHTSEGGMMITAGTGGAVTGRGASLLVLDDPVKNDQQANSEVYRRHTWDWFRQTAYTRLEPDASIVCLMTRWHEADLVGQLLSEMVAGGESWEVLRLPALAEDDDPLGRAEGEALWPARFPREELLRIKNTLTDHDFAALYQQRPRPVEGNMLKRQHFEIVDDYPAECVVTRFWDLASATKSSSDYTSGTKMGMLDGIYYIIDVRRVREAPYDVERLIRQTAELDGVPCHVWMEEEGGSSGKIVTDHYRREVLQGFSFRSEHPTGPKDVRAGPFAASVGAGNVKLVRGAWNKAFLDEAEAFPNGAHDDQIDSAVGAFEHLPRKRAFIRI
jgi:predicted phage terminase large subunit-like protein